MFKLWPVFLCLGVMCGVVGCWAHHPARPHGYAGIKAKMSTKEVAGMLGVAGTSSAEKHRCGKCYAWAYAGYYIKGYIANGEEAITRFSIFTNDGRLLTAPEAAADAHLRKLHPPMRYAAVCAALGDKGIPRTLQAYSWTTGEGQVTVEFENGKAYHKELIKTGGATDTLDLCPTASLRDK